MFRTYFINSRGDEATGTVWSYLDATPLGRQETWEDSPHGYPQIPPYKWWNWHDTYAADAQSDKRWVEVSEAGEAAFRKAPGHGRRVRRGMTPAPAQIRSPAASSWPPRPPSP